MPLLMLLTSTVFLQVHVPFHLPVLYSALFSCLLLEAHFQLTIFHLILLTQLKGMSKQLANDFIDFFGDLPSFVWTHTLEHINFVFGFHPF